MSRTTLIPMAVIALATGAAAPAAAQALDDRYWIEAQAYWPKVDTKATVSRPGATGTRIDFESDLGIDKHQTLPAVYGGVRLGERFVINGEYYGVDRDGSRTLTRDIVFDGATYPTSVEVDSKFRSDIYRATIGYVFLRSETAELGAGIGLHATHFELSVNGDALIGAGPGRQTERRGRKFLAPLPTIGAFGTFELTPKLIVTGRADYMSLKYGDYDGGVTNAQAAIAYRINPTFSAGVAYRYVAYNLDVDKERYTAKVDYDFSGPAIFLRAGFR
jgi:hypothetical protein